MGTTTSQTQAITHPLDPLTAEEIAGIAEVLRDQEVLPEGALIVSMTLVEPSKEQLAAHKPGDDLDRRALVVLRDHNQRATREAVVSATHRTVESLREVDGVQPGLTFEEVFAAIELVMGDPRWQEAVRARGVDDLSLATVDPWPTGHQGPTEDPERRLVRALTWVRSTPDGNAYARPVEGLLVLVDVDRGEVVEVEDHGVVPLPPRSGDYWPEAFTDVGNHPRFPGVRDDLRPIDITQPRGVSFEVRGHEVQWHKWRFRLGYTSREGLVLHTVAFDDRGRWRPILHRASLCEMVVPYGDPSPTHWRKNAFDVGEGGLGWLANSLELGCDCLGEIRYFDMVFTDGQGQPQTLTNAICMHEEDFSLSWKHFDFQTGRSEVRRRRRLVVSQISTIANYDYGLYWYLYEDGTIEAEVKSTGIVSTGAVPPEVEPPYGSLLAPGLYAPNHQHFFCFRLDLTVDGTANSLYEVHSEAAPADDNPHGNAWRVVETPLATESQAMRDADPASARHWKVVNPQVLNAVGQPVGYRLIPGPSVVSFFTDEAAVAARAGFARHHLWATPFSPEERFAAGEYPNQHPGGDGLPRWVAADRSLQGTDLVLWHVVGAHHPVRPEDWPVMPVTSAGFVLQPVGFFDGNPALDLPRPSHNGACHDHGADHGAGHGQA